MEKATTYLDYNATAPVRPEARDAVAIALEEGGNPSSVHRAGRLARRRLEDARERVAEAAGVGAQSVIFTSSGTEANNLVIHGLVAGAGVRRLFVSAIEHDCVLEAAKASGVAVEHIPCLPTGLIDADWLESRLAGYDVDTEGAFLVCVMHANNETGVIQPVGRISEAAHNAGGLLLVDAAQSFGKIATLREALGADALTFSGHKFGAPQGVGGIAIRAALPLARQLHGGGQEMRRRAGTENVPAIAGLGAALEAAEADSDAMARVGALRDRLEAGIAAIAPEAVFFGQEAPRLATTACFGVPGFSAETQVMSLDLAGVAISAGSACSSGKVTPSHVLRAMGAGDELAGSAIRVSLGWASDPEDVDRFVTAWADAYGRWAGLREQTKENAVG